MDRREFIAVSSSSALLGMSGCIDDLEGDTPEGADENDVPGCTSKEGWSTEITTGPADPDPDSIAGRHDCATADRPEPTGDVCETFELEKQNGKIERVHSVGVKPYPRPPTTFDEESLTKFVYEYEDAYSQNEAVSEYGERAFGAGADSKEKFTRYIDIYDGITVIGIRFAAPVSYRTRTGDFVGDDNFSDQVVYGIDKTGLVRLQEPYLGHDGQIVEDPPDPVEDGDLLECF